MVPDQPPRRKGKQRLARSRDRWSRRAVSCRTPSRRNGHRTGLPDRLLPPDPGDPIFVADRNGADARQICVGKPGIHEHYVTWSPSGRFVYFVRGIPPDQMDVWRIAVAGGIPERLTHHNSRVAYPSLLDERTLIYTATREDDSGSGLYAMDVERRVPHVASAGLEESRLGWNQRRWPTAGRDRGQSGPGPLDGADHGSRRR